jgi:hypothetical protein
LRSRSSHEIFWIKPDIEEEQWEFFRHPDKQGYYQQHDIGWSDIVSGFNNGELVQYPRSGTLNEIKVSLSYHTFEDYSRYLAKAKRGYRINYSRMEDELQRSGRLTMKAPIILTTGNEGMLFSGYRRLCLAWNHGMIPYVWLVHLNSCDRQTTEPADQAG